MGKHKLLREKENKARYIARLSWMAGQGQLSKNRWLFKNVTNGWTEEPMDRLTGHGEELHVAW